MKVVFKTSLKGAILSVFSKLIHQLDSFNAVVHGWYVNPGLFKVYGEQREVNQTNFIHKDGKIKTELDLVKITWTDLTVFGKAFRVIGDDVFKIEMIKNGIRINDRENQQSMFLTKNKDAWLLSVVTEGSNLPVMRGLPISLDNIVPDSNVRNGKVVGGRKFVDYVADTCNDDIKAVPENLKGIVEPVIRDRAFVAKMKEVHPALQNRWF